MGNILSGVSTRESVTAIEGNIRESQTMEDMVDSIKNNSVEFQYTESEDEIRAKRKEEEMNEFHKQLNIKREQRKEILSRHRREKEELERSLQSEIILKLELAEQNNVLRELLIKNNVNIPEELQASDENSEVIKAILQMKEEAEKLKSMNNKLRCELASTNNALQSAYSDLADLSAQNTESIKQITSLKEVITVSKTMIHLREEQLNQLKSKLNEIEQSLADRESHMLSTDLRQEYERQLQNIRTLRGLYEERARLAEVSRQALTRDLQEQRDVNQTQAKKISDLNAKVEELETTVSRLEDVIEEKNNCITLTQKETHGLKSEMEVVNKLFSQVLLGYKTKQDLDKLVNRLEENHGILTQMAERENGSEASTVLPKMLLQLVSQVEETEQTKESEHADNEKEIENSSNNKNDEEIDIQNAGNATAEEIVQNLPKVWRVLMELLSHQSVPETNDDTKVTTCYKSVDTKSGPVLVPSVSQTYIRLKDLIIEKLSLIKEVNRMKQLNGHLETRLQEQERRLCMVTTELGKTWHVVGRLRRHHHQLHTHEKILKYELQQKRKLLNELKEELEYCREKWEQAREKNSQSEKDWKKLREEFSSRKIKSTSMSFNNSAESGYSDEKPSDDSSDSNDEREYVKEPQMRCKKKIKKASETVLDSSADCNLAAEREDPASDMLDVADLPLDNQEPTEMSDASNSESVHKLKNTHIESEDENGDITNNSCLDESSVAEEFSESTPPSEDRGLEIEVINKVNNSPEQVPERESIIDPKQILNSIKEQNERLAKKDNKLEKLEKDSISLLKKTQNISKIGNEIDSTLNHLLNRPTSSKQHLQENVNDIKNYEENSNDTDIPSNSQLQIDNVAEENKTANGSKQLNETQLPQDFDDIKNVNSNSEKPIGYEKTVTSQEPSVDLEAILESIRRQNEHLALKDQRLQNLESGCSSVVNSITNTLSTGNDISNKLDTLHEEYTTARSDSNASTSSSSEQRKIEPKSTQSKPEPSVSNDIDHEAIFAARDERLKRLEEQTKSLVTKVNKTATKGVKINYKLEELQNIYASESSRAGTPSEENEENPQQSGADKENK